LINSPSAIIGGNTQMRTLRFDSRAEGSLPGSEKGSALRWSQQPHDLAELFSLELRDLRTVGGTFGILLQLIDLTIEFIVDGMYIPFLILSERRIGILQN
jgi:hypothetical protein